nr:MAG TPA: hypothetical protein [Caudoviricetes sp.]
MKSSCRLEISGILYKTYLLELVYPITGCKRW